jgi:hypothetical protein
MNCPTCGSKVRKVAGKLRHFDSLNVTVTKANTELAWALRKIERLSDELRAVREGK